ncbi:MAG: hypothetical protein GF355_16060, partial [Candidatus Eisenbacteria bacterium]|nr:hypothetical protein [Candidatus Eisenbacteria bacterium]
MVRCGDDPARRAAGQMHVARKETGARRATMEFRTILLPVLSSIGCASRREGFMPAVVVLAACLAVLAAPAYGARAAEELEPAGAIYDAAGALISSAPGMAEEPLPPRESPAFGPSVRVDDDINPEHRGPAVAWGPDGVIHCAYFERATHYNPELIMYTRSEDGGVTWQAPAVQVNDTAPNAVVFPAIVVDDESTIYLVWCEMKFSPYNYEVRFSRSTDAGQTWSPSAVIHPINSGEDYYRPSMVLAGERIVVSFWRETAYPNALPTVVYSDDGGMSWSDPITASTTPAREDGSAPCMAYNEIDDEIGMVTPVGGTSIWFYKSTDGGESWSGGVQV